MIEDSELMMKTCAWSMLLCLAVTALSACGGKSSEDSPESLVDSFATAYFNWQLPRCRQYVSDSSQVWLRYLASQVNEEDVDTLRARTTGATVELGNVDYSEDDSSAVVTVTVRDVLLMDTIGHIGRHADQQDYAIPVVRERGKWKVKLTGPLREER